MAIGTAIAVVVIAYAGWRQVRPGYSSGFLDASWSPAAAGRVVGHVVTWNGRPEVGQVVELTDDAGATRTAATDADGRFAVDVAGRPSRLTVVGIDAVPLTRWNLRGPGGAAVEVHLKRPPPPPRGPL